MALTGSTPAPSWEEDECLDYYGMLSLHRMFEVVGGQLTECELELLAFLLDEVPGAPGGLARARSGLELLLELERRGQCDESNLRLLGQLLRLLSRHDLLPHLARKRRRPGMVEWAGDRLPLGRGPCFRWASSVPDMKRAISDSMCLIALFPPPRVSMRNTRGRRHGSGRGELVKFGHVSSDVCGHCLRRAYFMPGIAVSPPSCALSPYDPPPPSNPKWKSCHCPHCTGKAQ